MHACAIHTCTYACIYANSFKSIKNRKLGEMDAFLEKLKGLAGMHHRRFHVSRKHYQHFRRGFFAAMSSARYRHMNDWMNAFDWLIQLNWIEFRITQWDDEKKEAWNFVWDIIIQVMTTGRLEQPNDSPQMPPVAASSSSALSEIKHNRKRRAPEADAPTQPLCPFAEMDNMCTVNNTDWLIDCLIRYDPQYRKHSNSLKRISITSRDWCCRSGFAQKHTNEWMKWMLVSSFCVM